MRGNSWGVRTNTGLCSLVLTARSTHVAADCFDETSPLGQRLQSYASQVFSYDILANAVIVYWKYPKLWYASLKLIFGERVARRLSKVALADVSAAKTVIANQVSPASVTVVKSVAKTIGSMGV